MNQRQFFHSTLLLFSVFLFTSGFGLLADISPQFLPWIKFGLSDFYAVMRWKMPAFSSASHIVPLLLPFLTNIGFAILIFFKANDLASKFFHEDSQSSLLIQLRPEECLRWGITLIGLFLLVWITLPSLFTTVFHPLVMNSFPNLKSENPDMDFVHAMYWKSFLGNIGRFLIQGSFGVVCLLFAPRLAAWIIRIQKHPRSSQPQ